MHTSIWRKATTSALGLCCLFGAAQAQDNGIHIIPEPVSVMRGIGHFTLGTHTRIVYSNTGISDEAKTLQHMLGIPTGYPFPTRQEGVSGIGDIDLVLNKVPDSTLGDEGYDLEITPKHLIIHANKPAGIFYGMQSLMQLLPADIEASHKVGDMTWTLPSVHIVDYPRFGWRGLMLDVSRHFFPVSFIKSYIDEMVKYKYNVFHWHLTDDNGWRIQIKGLPALTQVGAWRVPRTGRWGTFKAPQPGEQATYGGFYTQDEIREIVRYAQKRFVTIIPEVDVPAHSMSLIAAYPNLSCTQEQYPVNPGSNFYTREDNVLCVANDSTYLILDKIFGQIAKLFPAPYIHVGGDEAYKGFWAKDPKDIALMKKEHMTSLDQLQSYFIKKVEKIVESKGKKLIGWDEILEGGLAPNATVMSWRGMQGGIDAAKAGHHVIMTPNSYAYLDLYQGDPLVEPPTYGMLRLNTCYSFEPVPDSVDPKLILGGQGNLWTESVPNARQAEYMTWPRAMALSEVFWSPKSRKNWGDFVTRLQDQFPRLDAEGVKYSLSMYDPIISGVLSADSSLLIKIDTQVEGLQVHYSFDETDPDAYYPTYDGQPLVIPKGARMIKAISYLNGKPVGHMLIMPFTELEKRMHLFNPPYSGS